MKGEMIDTRSVTNRRVVHLRTLNHLTAEIERIIAAASVGQLRTLGNWTPAQVLWHIGKLIELSFDGFPFRYEIKPRWLVRLMRFLSWRYLIALAFRPGFQNPSYAVVLEPDPSLSLDDASGYLKRQLARIHSGEQMTKEASIEGPYTHEQWIYIHLRHAELHLSFLSYAKGEKSTSENNL
jgi:hypothetical protein